jgi:hypothetical protein
MRTQHSLILALTILCVGAVLAFGFMKRDDFRPWPETGREVRSRLGGEIVQVKQPRTIVAALPGVVVGTAT